MSATTTLVIKTEGVSEGYKDIGKLLGPLQGINTMLYQLNKTLGITSKTATANGKSMHQLAKAGDQAAKSQLELQKQLRSTVKEAAKASKEQLKHAHDASDSLRGLNLKAGVDLALKAGKELVKVGKEVYKFAADCLETYYAQADVTDEQRQTLDFIKTTTTAIKALIGKIIAQNLDSYMQDVADPVHAIGNVMRGIAQTVVTVVEYATVIKEVVHVIGAAMVRVLWEPMKRIAQLASNVVKVLSYIPGLGDKMAEKMRTVADTISDFGGMMDFGVRDFRDAEAAITQAHAEGEQRRAAVTKYVSDAAIGDMLSQVKKTAEAQAKSHAATTQAKQAEKLSAEQQHQLNLQHIATEKAAKLAALDEIQGDEQLKAQVRAAILQQNLEAEKNEILRYARETNDQKTIVAQQYLDTVARAEADALERQKALAKQTNEDIAESGVSLGDQLREQVIGSLGDSIAGLFDSVIAGEELTREGAYDMFQSLAKNVAKIGLQTLLSKAGELIMTVGKSAGETPVVGPILAAAAMATFGGITAGLMAKYKPKQEQVSYANGGYITQGLVRGGQFGRDSVTASLMPGERVLSKREAEAYDSTPKTSSVNVYLTVNSANLTTTTQVDTLCRNTLIPALQRALGQGYRLGA